MKCRSSLTRAFWVLYPPLLFDSVVGAENKLWMLNLDNRVVTRFHIEIVTFPFVNYSINTLILKQQYPDVECGIASDYLATDCSWESVYFTGLAVIDATWLARFGVPNYTLPMYSISYWTAPLNQVPLYTQTRLLHTDALNEEHWFNFSLPFGIPTAVRFTFSYVNSYQITRGVDEKLTDVIYCYNSCYYSAILNQTEVPFIVYLRSYYSEAFVTITTGFLCLCFKLFQGKMQLVLMDQLFKNVDNIFQEIEHSLSLTFHLCFLETEFNSFGLFRLVD